MADVDTLLALVRHDLVKRVVWPARDRRDMGGPVQQGELVPDLVDQEGNPTSAQDLWRALLGDAGLTEGAHASALATFERALRAAAAAAARDDLEGVLALESAFADLARALKGG